MMELIENVLEFLKLQGGKTLSDAQGKSDIAWIKLWWKLVLLFGVLIADAELKMHGYTHVVSWAMLGIPLFALLVLGNPTRQVQFSTIWALFVHKDKDTPFKDKLADGFKEYWTIVGIVILWAVFIPLGIKLIPIQYCPAAFWTFLPAIAAHELAWWRGWHNDLERDFRRYSITGLKWIIYACLLLPFLFAAKEMVYERYGYAMPTPSTSTAAINQATHENEELLEAKRTECVRKITEQSVKKEVPLTKTDLAAMEACKTKYASPILPDSTQKEGAGNVMNGHSLLGMGLWAIIWGHILWFVGAAILGALGWRLFKKKDDTAVVSTSKTVAVEKKTKSSFPWGGVFVLGLMYLAASWYIGSWITSSADVSQLTTKLSQKGDSGHAAQYPDAFLTPEEVKTWQAAGTSPSYHPNFGEIAGRTFQLETGSQSGVRPNLYEKLERGFGKPLLIKVEENNPKRDVVLENTTCNEPKIHSDGRIYKVCTGSWRSGDRLIHGRYELIYSAENRIATLRSAGSEPITFTFQPK